ncbi:unnamed protein product [Effrenium voratum]|nr:unnamed protein product [Effrenium voratum]CAJ1458301.1 unnamed protein product [Effrenium voratum]|mmetsp:Transcript_93599/g.222518  ORF Transcript_93599/g.222518 Transcript_93599/m.222518 type:complete len:231 (-) Transcript_93599:21-713(-)
MVLHDDEVDKAKKKNEELSLKGDGSRDLSLFCAVYLENPDGSISLGLPPEMRLPSPPNSPRGRSRDFAFMADVWGGGGALPSGPPPSPAVFQQHERMFSLLLVLELVVEIFYVSLLCRAARHSVFEVAAAYRALPLESLWTLFWAQLAMQMAYLKLYFCTGFTAAHKHKPRLYAWFSNVALSGIVIQVLFSYMNKANILVFALRLFSYVYARFLRSMLLQIAMHARDLDV